MAITARRLAVGAAAAGAYVIAVVVTLSVTGHHVRPLYEGFAPNAPYQWVNPPPAFAATNQPPKANDVDLPLGPSGIDASSPASSEAQLVLGLGAGAIGAHPPDTAARVRIEPLDPVKLGDVPQGLFSDGNAYRVTLTYQPSGGAATLATPGNVVMVVPLAGTTILYSADGQAWTKLPTQTLAGTANLGATFSAPGYYLAAGPTQIHGLAGEGGGGGNGTWFTAGAVVALAVLLVGGPLVARRLRAPGGRGGPRRPSAPAPNRRPAKRPAKPGTPPAKYPPRKRKR
jgi:hypothetical protein